MYLHRLHNDLALKLCQITVNGNFDHNNDWENRDKNNDKSIECHMEPIQVAKAEYLKAKNAKALIGLSGKDDHET